MDDRQQLYTALRNADAAGDTEAATKIAKYIQSLPPAIAPKVQPDTWSTDPTEGMSVGQKLAAGAGKAYVDMGHGIRQLGADIGAKIGFVSPAAASAMRQQESQRERQDYALIHDPLGAGANAATNALLSVGLGEAVGAAPGAGKMMAALGPGKAAQVVKAGAGGGALGAIQPVGTDTTRQQNVAAGALGGMVGTVAGQAIGAGAGMLKNKLAAMAAQKQANNALVDLAAQNARQAGYAIPTSTTNPKSTLNQVLEGALSGKIKTAQAASAKNQQVTQSLVKQDLGIPEDVPLSLDAVRSVRSAAAKAYDNVRNAGPMAADKQFGDALDDIVAKNAGANRSFPGLVSHDAEQVVAPLRQPGFDSGDAVDAVRHLRDVADLAYRAGDVERAKTAKGAAKALEDLIERNLQQSGNSAGLDAFRSARQLMAKTYSAEKAINPETGMIDAAKLAAELRKGKPLTGGMRQVAGTAAAFPKAMQSLKEDPQLLSPLDYAMGTMTAVGSGNPLGALAMAARPAARAVVLSPIYQKAMGGRSYGSPTTNALLQYLQSPAAQQTATMAGIIAPQMQGR